jgi:hypothetical protein
MDAVLQWTSVALGMLALGFFWVAYLIRLVLNEEVVQEGRRRRNRAREEQRRAAEDRVRLGRRRSRPAASRSPASRG